MTTPLTPPAVVRRRKRRWLRWTIAGVATLVVLTVGGAALAIKLQPTAAPLALPAIVAAPAGPVGGTYQAASGSLAGFRVQQTVIGLTSDVVGRTNDVSGVVVVAGGQVTTADLRIGLLALTSGASKPAPQFGLSLETAHYPNATVDLKQPINLNAAFASGATISVNATGQLTLHSVTRTIVIAISARRDGTGIDVAGSFPVTFADYGIVGPKGYGTLGSLADHGVAEFLLVLHRS